MASSTLRRIQSYSSGSGSDSDFYSDDIDSSITVSDRKDYLGLIDIEELAKLQISIAGVVGNSTILGSPSSTETLLLGAGGSFVVRRVSNESLGPFLRKWDEGFDPKKRFVVVKQPSVREGDDDFDKRLYDAMMELKVSYHAPLRKHPNIVHLHSFMWDIQSNNADALAPSLIMEYADLGTVSDFQDSDRLILHADAKLQICLDIAEGLSFLNKCGIVHGDVKSENIFLFRDRIHEKRHVTAIRAKIGDFGSALIGVFDDPNRPKQRFRGYSPPWDAPERVEEMDALGLWRMDMYSYGLTVWRIMCNGKMPYRELFWDSTRKNVSFKPAMMSERPVSKADFVALKKKDNTLLQLAIDTLKDRSKSDVDRIKIQKVLEVTVCVDPTSRASSFDDIVNILRQGDSGKSLVPVPKPEPLTEGNFGITDPRFAHFIHILRTTPASFRSLICEQLTKNIQSTETESKRASYHLALGVCYWQRFYCNADQLFPTLSDEEFLAGGAAEILKAAELGNPIAQSIAPRAVAFVKSQNRASQAVLKEWLVHSIRHGSIRARNDLKKISPFKFNETVIQIMETRQKVAVSLSSHEICPYPADYFEGIPDLDPAAKVTLCHAGVSRLHQAAYVGAITVCQELIEKFRFDVDILDNKKETPLHYAVRNCQLVVAQYLLDKGANINAQRQGGAGALHLAFCSYETEIILAFLLDRGADPETASSSNLDQLQDHCDYFIHGSGTPLHMSIRCESPEAALILLEHNANPNHAVEYVGSPLRVGVATHSMPIVETLIPWAVKNGGNLPIDQELYSSLVGFFAQPMYRYLYWENQSSLPFILSAIESFEKSGSDVDERLLLNWALDADDVEVVDHFLNKLFSTKEVVPSTSQDHSASESNWLLVTMDFPHAAERKNIFTTVLSTGSKEMIKTVLGYIIKPISSYDDVGTPLLSHIGFRPAEPREDLDDIVSWLIEAGVNLNATDSLGKGPLRNAVAWNNSNLADILLDLEPSIEDVQNAIELCVAKGSSLTAETIMRCIFRKFPKVLTTPLPKKQHDFDFDFMNLLNLTSRHDPNYLRAICRRSEFSQPKNQNAGILQEAIQCTRQYIGGDLAIKERLAEHDDLFMTPLHYAATNGNIEAAQTLLDEGANINSYSVIPMIGSSIDLPSFTCTNNLTTLDKDQKYLVMASSGPTPLDIAYDRNWDKLLSRWQPSDRKILQEIRLVGGANKEEFEYEERTQKMVDFLRANGGKTRLEIFGYPDNRQEGQLEFRR